jgi:hypothetical protein
MKILEVTSSNSSINSSDIFDSIRFGRLINTELDNLEKLSYIHDDNAEYILEELRNIENHLSLIDVSNLQTKNRVDNFYRRINFIRDSLNISGRERLE